MLEAIALSSKLLTIAHHKPQFGDQILHEATQDQLEKVRYGYAPSGVDSSTQRMETGLMESSGCKMLSTKKKHNR
ncbi:hypothetical protein PGT21_006808 [Puccinia graminis f. sp. tritici]|uniref:Uncharacterized protein n=1 Tax=Puccinia graminis f. sp. tritici TaxID=56615 RepID=A0A5B0PRV6_PUCGR|nr:hypothetical protein PGT21_006808 [Puccinia graminis f. sp. tritici]